MHPKTTALSATTATVVDCAYSTSGLVYANSGKPVAPVTRAENDGVQATLVLTGGTWKVSKQNVTDVRKMHARVVIPPCWRCWCRCWPARAERGPPMVVARTRGRMPKRRAGS